MEAERKAAKEREDEIRFLVEARNEISEAKKQLEAKREETRRAEEQRKIEEAQLALERKEFEELKLEFQKHKTQTEQRFAQERRELEEAQRLEKERLAEIRREELRKAAEAQRLEEEKKALEAQRLENNKENEEDNIVSLDSSTSYDHVELLRKKREAQEKLNNTIQNISIEHIDIKEKLEKITENDIVDEDLIFCSEIIDKIDNINTRKRIDLISEIIAKEDVILDIITDGIEQEYFQGEIIECQQYLKIINRKRQFIVEKGNEQLQYALSKEDNKYLLNNVVTELEKNARSMISTCNTLVKRYVSGLKEKTNFQKKCNKKVKSTHGYIIIGLELILFLGTLLIIYLTNK